MIAGLKLDTAQIIKQRLSLYKVSRTKWASIIFVEASKYMCIFMFFFITIKKLFLPFFKRTIAIYGFLEKFHPRDE